MIVTKTKRLAQATYQGVCPITNIFIRQFMGQANTLRLMLNGTTVYNGMFELFNNGLMDGVALYSYMDQPHSLSKSS
jgi:hypothetical protein